MSTPKTTEIKVAAAASLINGLEIDSAGFISAITKFKSLPGNSSIDFDVTYEGSIELANQIANPADSTFDVFLSASENAMTTAGCKVDTTTQDEFIKNSLVLIKNMAWLTNTPSPALPSINSFADVNSVNFPLSDSSKHIWLADPTKAPAGKYAKDALDRTSPSSWSDLLSKATDEHTLGDDVQETLAGLIADTTPAVGIVYRSDYLNLPSKPLVNTKFVTYAPYDTNVQIIYYAAALTDNAADHGVEAVAKAFVLFLQTNLSVEQSFTEKGFRAINSTAPSPSDPIKYERKHAKNEASI